MTRTISQIKYLHVFCCCWNFKMFRNQTVIKRHWTKFKHEAQYSLDTEIPTRATVQAHKHMRTL